jgi:hypothetical protein
MDSRFMPNFSVGAGAALIAIGVVGYAATGGVSPTALIPAVFGAILVAAGIAARSEKRRGVAMHVAVAFGLLGLLGSFRGVPMLAAWLSGGEVARPAAAVSQALMAAVCATFVTLAVRSFVMARRARAAQSRGAATG